MKHDTSTPEQTPVIADAPTKQAATTLGHAPDFIVSIASRLQEDHFTENVQPQEKKNPLAKLGWTA